MCICIHTGAVFTAPHMCTYIGACDAPHMCTYIQKQLTLHCKCVYEYTLRIGFHRSTHVYIHKAAYAALHMCMNIHSGSVFIAPRMCTYTRRSLRCITHVYVYTHRSGLHRSTHVYIHRSLRCSTHVYIYTNAAYAALQMCMCIHSGSVFIAPRMCTYTNAVCAALHMCMCIHTGAGFTAPYMCTYTGACDVPHMCTYTKQLTLHCKCV